MTNLCFLTLKKFSLTRLTSDVLIKNNSRTEKEYPAFKKDTTHPIIPHPDKHIIISYNDT